MEEKPNYYAVIPADVRYDNDLRANEKLLYGEITSLANKTGSCWASNDYFSALYNVQPNAVATWIRHLKEKDYILVDYEYKKGTKEILKRIITIGGIQKDKTSYSKRYEGGIQKDKDNNTSINTTRINNKEIYKESFEKVWEIYPNKKGKTNAYKSFEKAIKNGITLETIVKGLQNYIAYIKAERIEQRFIKNGSTWFNQHCWEDDYTITRKPTTKDLANNMDFTDFLNDGRV